MLWLSVAPAALCGLAYEIFLGPRHDYTGHFLAGYAGSLGAISVWLKTLSSEQFRRWSLLGLPLACLACVLIGAGLEATAFRIAKFDEIDFCNQSLGAVLAAAVAMAFAGEAKPPDAVFDRVLIVAVAFLGVGSIFAVA
jgi:hypothetical protein